jgi:putative membrane protein
MRALWLLLKCILVLALVLLGAVFALKNSLPLSVNFVLLNSPEISVGLWLIIFLAAGTVLGLFSSALIIASYRRKLARVTQKD